MKIKYAARSQFTNICINAIEEQSQELLNGNEIRIFLKNGGYDNKIIVEIDNNDKVFFDTNWNNLDPTRFPARIKATATALLHLNHIGKFEISHNNGLLIIVVK